jgi:hypothetical protein
MNNKLSVCYKNTCLHTEGKTATNFLMVFTVFAVIAAGAIALSK